MVTLQERSFIEELKMTFTLLSAYKSAAHCNVIAYENNKDIEITLKELTKLAEKKKWLAKFRQSYSGGQAKESDGMYSNHCKFLVAMKDGKELGYIRIVNYSDMLEKFGGTKTWSVSEAYVKPCYRNNGVLREMLKQVVANYSTKVIRIETYRYIKNFNYYYTLGFTYAYTVQGGELTLAFQTDVVGAVERRNAYYDKLEAANEEYLIAA